MADVKEQEQKQPPMDPMQKRLFDLRLKLNASRKANKREVVEEHKRASDPNYEKKRKQTERTETQENSTTKQYMHHTIKDASMKAKKKKYKDKHQASFGWDVFNQDALYNAYKKRLDQLPASSSQEQDALEKEHVTSGLNYGRNDYVSKKGVENMVKELDERAKARKNFSRRRQHYEGKDVDYINDRNKHFNEKISRAFDKYTVEIRQNLERGTAL